METTAEQKRACLAYKGPGLNPLQCIKTKQNKTQTSIINQIQNPLHFKASSQSLSNVIFITRPGRPLKTVLFKKKKKRIHTHIYKLHSTLGVSKMSQQTGHWLNKPSDLNSIPGTLIKVKGRWANLTKLSPDHKCTMNADTMIYPATHLETMSPYWDTTFS